MAAVLGKVLKEMRQWLHLEGSLHIVPEGICGEGGERVLSRGSTEPDLCFRKITLMGLWKVDWEGQLRTYCAYSPDQKLRGLSIKTALACLKSIQGME